MIENAFAVIITKCINYHEERAMEFAMQRFLKIKSLQVQNDLLLYAFCTFSVVFQVSVYSLCFVFCWLHKLRRQLKSN